MPTAVNQLYQFSEWETAHECDCDYMEVCHDQALDKSPKIRSSTQVCASNRSSISSGVVLSTCQIQTVSMYDPAYDASSSSTASVTRPPLPVLSRRTRQTQPAGKVKLEDNIDRIKVSVPWTHSLRI